MDYGDEFRWHRAELQEQSFDNGLLVHELMTAIPKDCVMFLTHLWDPRMARHYARFKREVGRVFPVFLAYHSADGSPPPTDLVPDILVTNEMIKRAFPKSFDELVSNTRGSLYANVQLVWLTAFGTPQLQPFDRLWIVENDVDYSGDWADFFSQTGGYGADVVATYFRWRHDEPDWILLQGAIDPLDRKEDQLMGFFPISRFSRRAIDVLSDAYRLGEWKAHFELSLPTIAHRAGLSIADLGGSGALTPRERLGRHYEGNYKFQTRSFYTYGFGHPMQHYYSESRLGYWDRNRLYHPIKLRLTGRGAFLSWSLKFRDSTRRRLARSLLRREPRRRARGPARGQR